VLGDPEHRRAYDEGAKLEDLEGLEGMFSADGIDPKKVQILCKMHEQRAAKARPAGHVTDTPPV
jgi:hypothetical protein